MTMTRKKRCWMNVVVTIRPLTLRLNQKICRNVERKREKCCRL